MSTGSIAGFGMSFLAFAAGLFVFFVGVGALILLVLFVMDISQTKQAIRRNYPVLGRLRYMGVSGREESPKHNPLRFHPESGGSGNDPVRERTFCPAGGGGAGDVTGHHRAGLQPPLHGSLSV
jgi:hypothetical protein